MSQETDTTELSGLDKASLLLVTLGSSAAGTVLKHLTAEEAQMLGARIATQKAIDASVRTAIADEFVKSHQSGSATAGIDFAREVLQQALGPAKAEEVLSELSADSRSRPFGWLRQVASSSLAASLANERPQVTALVLSHLPPSKAAEVVSQLPEEAQGCVAYRLTQVREVLPEVTQTLESALRNALQGGGGARRDEAEGLRTLVEILNNSDRATEAKILEYLERTESAVAESVRSMLFAFEDIVRLDDQTLQTVIQALEQEDLRLAIKGSSDEIKEAFLRNMSQRAADAMREDLEMMGRVKVRDVEAAQRRIVSVIRELDERGEIAIHADAEGEDYVA